MKSIAFLAFCLLSLSLNAQNIFPKMLDTCVTDHFCLDCGDEKGDFDKVKFSKLLEEENATKTYKKLNGTVKFQVLIDSLGRGCVLSHNDSSGHPAVTQIINALNKFDGWIPAKTDGKAEWKTSVNMVFTIKKGILEGKIERVDIDAFEDSFESSPTKTTIENVTYTYNNKHLKDYTFIVWNKENSALSSNSNHYVAVDGKNRLWVTSDNDIFYLENEKLTSIGGPDIKNPSYFALAADTKNVLWTFSYNGIYSYNGQWKKYDPKNVFGVDGGYYISCSKEGEVFFCSDQGLVILKDDKWSNLNKDNLKELPSNRVCYAKRDSTGRLWISTFSGTIIIDKNNIVTNFNKGNTPLANRAIISMDEDGNGNFYFGLFDCNAYGKDRVDGIGIWHSDGKWEHLTIQNSGLPYSEANGIIYDKTEKVLWISSEKAGLARYDLKGNWENYNSENSNLPTSTIRDITSDSKGNIYIGTTYGLVQLKRNKP